MTSLSPVDLGASLSSIGDAASVHAQAALRLKGKAKEAAQNFEANFLSSMFQDMFTEHRRRRPVRRQRRTENLALVHDRADGQIICQGRRHWHSADGVQHLAQGTGPDVMSPIATAAQAEQAIDDLAAIDGKTRRPPRTGDAFGPCRPHSQCSGPRTGQGGTCRPVVRGQRTAEGQRKIFAAIRARPMRGAAAAAGHVSRHSAEEHDRAGHRACGVGRHHAPAVRRSRPQGGAADLWRDRAGRGAQSQGTAGRSRSAARS